MMCLQSASFQALKRERRKGEQLGTQGSIAQLGERLPCKQEVSGSIPLGSTKFIIELVYVR
jgi:hypothetical protein